MGMLWRMAGGLALLVGVTVLARGEGELPFRHVLVEPHNIGADCKAIGDLSGDGFPDVVVADDTGIGLQWYEYPKWTKHVIETRSVFTTDMQVADVDRDSDIDIVVPDIKANVMLWYPNPRVGGGNWKPVTIGSPYGHDVEVGDVNHDGKLDVVARTGDTTLFIQRTPTSWAKQTLPTGGRGGTDLGDADRDGDLDIAENGYWLECPRDPVRDSWTRHDVAPGWPEDVGVRWADLNGDHRLDLILAPAESAGKLVWYEAPRDPRGAGWTEHLTEDGVSHIHTFPVADMDGDGDLDLVTAEMEQSPRKRVTVHLNEGKGLRWRRQVLSTRGAHNVRVGDIGRDGDLDVVGANFGLTPESYSPVELWESLLRNPRRAAGATAAGTGPQNRTR